MHPARDIGVVSDGGHLVSWLRQGRHRAPATIASPQGPVPVCWRRSCPIILGRTEPHPNITLFYGVVICAPFE